MSNQTRATNISLDSTSCKSMVIELPKRLSVLEAVSFKNSCDQILTDETLELLVLECQQTQFIDSSGIGALVHLLKATKLKQIKLVLKNVHPPVMGVLGMTGLDQVLEIQPLEGDLSQPKSHQNRELPTTHPSVRSWVKRLIDIVGSIVGLAITAVIFIPIAIAIKKSSPGPIFFGQIRCGWMGKRFRIWKFRSMRPDAEQLKYQVQNKIQDGKMFKNENDNRVFPLGKFLRRTSLDELPQFWNVLKGEMSLVGTRPPTPDEVEKYEVPEWQRLDVKPGMTGEWQVNGRSTVRSFDQVIELDLVYQRNWSLWYDTKLIFKTVMILFTKNSGAY